jgi:outer membrane lipoprotein carrier protein
MKQLTIVLMILALWFGGVAQTMKKVAPEQSKKMVETVNKATASVKSIQCDFTQVRQSTMLKEKQTSKGKMSFSGKNLKWEYTEPNKFALTVKEENGQQQVYIQQDGKTKKADSQSGQLFKGIAQIVMGSVTGAALSDNGDFTVEMYTQGDIWVAKLTPKQPKLKKMFTSILLYFNEKHNAVTRVEMKEANGDGTVITFANVKLN